jgi:M6 family metalloprotease-like protein
MPVKRTWVAVLAVTLLLGFVPQNATGAVKAGATCAKLKSTTTVLGYKYTCIKSGKKLVWSKGVKVVATPKPSPLLTPKATSTPTPTATATSTPTPTPSTSSSQSSTSSDTYSDQPCKTEGEELKTETASYKCLKRTGSGALLWSKNNAPSQSASPTPTPAPSETAISLPTPTPTPTPTIISTSDSIDSCRIKDASNPEIGQYGGALYGGFIDKNRPVPSSGTVTWYLVPIEFADLKGESDWRSRVDEQMTLLTEYYETVSYGKLKIQWKVYDGWIALPGGQTSYAINQSGDYISTEIFWKAAIETVDPKIDFTGIQVVNFILPKAQAAVKESAQGFPWTGDINKYNSIESKLSEFSVPGNFFDNPNRTYWSYWAHEYGHTLGLPHIAGSRFVSAFHPFDLMGDQDARRELSGWTRFAVTSWLEDKWVYCKNKENVTSELVYITDLNSKDDGNKLIVIPLNSTKALIVESRIKTKFVGSTFIAGRTDGVFVYIYDATLGHNKEYLSLPSGTTDPILIAGESVTYEGLTIKVLETGTLDKILITR